MVTAYPNIVYKEIEKARPFGYRQLDNGTKLYGQLPNAEDTAWFHMAFAPLKEAGIVEIEEHLKVKLPEDLVQFYFQNNGLNLFSDHLSFYGLRTKSEEEMIQPYDIVTTNLYELSKSIHDTFLIIGSYLEDGSKLLYQLQTGKIYRFKRGKSDPLKVWKGLGELLNTEIKRLSSLFDAKGKMIGDLQIAQVHG